jgi:uncharacterized protein (TIGR00251 family)
MAVPLRVIRVRNEQRRRPSALLRLRTVREITMTPLRIDQRGGSIRFAVHVQPRAARTEIVGLHGDALKVRLTAPPANGAANAALVELLADALGVARRCVRIVAGATSRGKIVEVNGVNVENIRRLARESG